MTAYQWISLTTDYGLEDGFVAACHGVIARRAPQVRVVDITHAVPPGDVVRGAAVLADTVSSLPPAVHVAVVDPGVGTDRRGIALRAPGGLLVGPDNGLLLEAAGVLGGIRAVVELRNAGWFETSVSRTFHGRDIFAPVAARLALGADLADAGPPVHPDTLVRLPTPVVRRGDGWLEAEVRTVDRFGNVQLAAAGPAPREGSLVVMGLPATATTNAHATPDGLTQPVTGQPAAVGGTFADTDPGGLVVLVDSSARLTVAVNGGSAAERLGLAPGDLVRIEASPTN